MGGDRGGIVDLEDDAGNAVDAEGGAGVDMEMAGGEEERMREGVVCRFDVEFEVTAFEAHAHVVVVGGVPGADVDVHRLGEGVGGVGGVGVGAEEDSGSIEAPSLDELHGQKTLDSDVRGHERSFKGATGV